LVDRMRRLSKLEAGIGKTTAMWHVLRDMHPLMRKKVMDEEAGYTNHTRPSNLDALRVVVGDDAGVRWLLKNDWDTAYSIEYDLDVIRGSGQGHDIAEFCAEREGGTLEENHREAVERLQKLKHLPPRRWYEVYAHELEEDTLDD
jgi:hypothetical protein